GGARVKGPEAPAGTAQIRAGQANRRSTASKNPIRSCGALRRRTLGSNTVVTKPTPPIHRTIERTCSARATVTSSICQPLISLDRNLVFSELQKPPLDVVANQT